jgi:hypothetical protein
MKIIIFFCLCFGLIYYGSINYPPHGGLITGILLTIFINSPIGEKILNKFL